MLISEGLAEFTAKVEYGALPREVVRLAKERILDTLGAAVAGEADWELKEPFLNACRGMGTGDCAVLGSGKREFPTARAAMINATFAHAAELDDGHKNAGCHAGAVVVPAALTLGWAQGASGAEILTAVVLGYEVVYRVVAGMTPHQIRKGFHPSGNCDTFGAMAAAGRLMGLSAGQIANGLGFAGLSAAGLMEATVSGQQSKCVQVGNAAYNGIAAALYAREGMAGTVTVFEGKSGFFQAQSQDVDTGAVCRGLGEQYHIGDTYSKLYPTCRHSQPAIEGVLDLMEEYGFGYREVEAVRVGTHQVAMDLTGRITLPESASEAKFSLAYGVALALSQGGVGIGHLGPKYRQDPVVRELAGRVHVEVDPEVQALYPARRGARVQVELKDGRVFQKELYDLKGSPENPIGWKELEQKFTVNLKGSRFESSTRRLAEQIAEFETLERIDGLMGLLCR